MTSKNLLLIFSLGIVTIVSCSKEETDSIPTVTYPRLYTGNVDMISIKYEPSPWGNLYLWDTVIKAVYEERTVEKDLNGDLYVGIYKSWGLSRNHFGPDSSFLWFEERTHAHQGSSVDSIYMKNYGDSIYFKRRSVGPWSSTDIISDVSYEGMLYP